MVLLPHVAIKPTGKPVAVPIPVAPVVLMEILGVRVLLIQIVRGGVEAAVLLAETIIVPLALMAPHPPVNGIE